MQQEEPEGHSLSAEVYGEQFVMLQGGVRPPRRIEPYLNSARSIRGLLRSVSGWQPGQPASRPEILAAAYLFMENLYQASRGGGTQPERLGAQNPQARRNRQNFQDAMNWVFQRADSNWRIDDNSTYALLEPTGNAAQRQAQIQARTHGERVVRIRAGGETTTIPMPWSRQTDLRAARAQATQLVNAINNDLTGGGTNTANVRALWQSIRGNPARANFILLFANQIPPPGAGQTLHALNRHIRRDGNTLVIHEGTNADGEVLHRIE
jgi:hypothetical protein